MQRVECGAAINTLVNLNELAGESPSLECASHVERVGRRSAPWAEAGARLVRASANAPGRMRPAGAGARPGRVSMLWAPVRVLACPDVTLMYQFAFLHQGACKSGGLWPPGQPACDECTGKICGTSAGPGLWQCLISRGAVERQEQQASTGAAIPERNVLRTCNPALALVIVLYPRY